MYKLVGGVPPAQASGAPPPKLDLEPLDDLEILIFGHFRQVLQGFYEFPPRRLDSGGTIFPPEFAVFLRFYKVFYEFPPRGWHLHNSPCRPKRCFTKGFRAFYLAGDQPLAGEFIEMLVSPRVFEVFRLSQILCSLRQSAKTLFY